jgi:hypothetical protein
VSPGSYTADLITGALDGTLGSSNALLLQRGANSDVLRVQSSGAVTAGLGMSAPAGVDVTGASTISAAVTGTGVWTVAGALTVGTSASQQGGRGLLVDPAGRKGGGAWGGGGGHSLHVCRCRPTPLPAPTPS